MPALLATRLATVALIATAIAAALDGPVASAAPKLPTSRPAMGAELDLVRQVLAEQLGLALVDVTPQKTFGQLAANELDLLEATMEIEDRLSITIDDASLDCAAGTKDLAATLAKLTVERFARVVTDARRAAATRPAR